MSAVTAFVAANRFGLGAWPGELSRIAGAPREWLLEQIGEAARTKALAARPASRELVSAILNIQFADSQMQRRTIKERLRATYDEEALVRLSAAVRTPTPFAERWVRFWGNHFTVSALDNEKVGMLAGSFEREAIRPHAFSRFIDMLLASTRHPAMLLYLDNAVSVGPDSPSGRGRRGFNENLGREILELHTMGVDGGYSQADVTALALMLTGWTLDGMAWKERANGRFRFEPEAHQPGAKVLLGRRYEEAGEAEAEAALRDIARHPATAFFIARKLVRHFVADQPPPHAVDALARTVLDTDGDLGALARAVVALPDAWQEPLAKLKRPDELVISTLRAMGPEAAVDESTLASLRDMGQLPFEAPSPAGWSDLAGDWIAPAAMMRRIRWAQTAAERMAEARPPLQVFADTIAPVASAGTRQAVARAPDPATGLALVFASPEFQRR